MAFTTTTGANGVVSLVGTSGVDTATLTALTSQVFVGAQASNDVIVAAFANGTNLGSAFTVNGGTGNDTITFAGQSLTGSFINGDGGTEAGGADTLTFTTLVTSNVQGGDANDAITFTNLQSTIVNGNKGVDTITFNGGNILSSSVYGGQGNDTYVAGASLITNTVINGNKGDDIIAVNGSLGFAGSTIYGGQGSDTMTFVGTATIGGVLEGDLGNDIMTGGAGRDTLGGGDGIDSITGGLLGDSMSGGAGDDTFVQTGTAVNAGGVINAAGTIMTFTSTGVDIVTDFTATSSGAVVDRIDADTTFATAVATQSTFAAVAGAAAAATLRVVRGTFNAGANTFTTSATGADALLATGIAGNVAITGVATDDLTVLLGAGAQTFVIGNVV